MGRRRRIGTHEEKERDKRIRGNEERDEEIKRRKGLRGEVEERNKHDKEGK